MTQTEQLAVARLIDDLEEAHHDRDDKRFDELTRAARALLRVESAGSVRLIRENGLVYYQRAG